MELYHSYRRKLASLLAVEDTGEDKPLIGEDELSEAVEAMGDMAATFDYDSLRFLFESLDGYRLPEKEAALYKEIKEAAAKPDWDRVNELVRKFH